MGKMRYKCEIGWRHAKRTEHVPSIRMFGQTDCTCTGLYKEYLSRGEVQTLKHSGCG